MPVDTPPLVWGEDGRDVASVREHVRRVAQAVRAMLRGGSNSGGVVTLTPGATTTTVVDERIVPQSRVFLSPTTANAAAALATTYAVCGVGSCVLNHANNAQTDRTFAWELKG